MDLWLGQGFSKSFFVDDKPRICLDLVTPVAPF